MHRETHAAKRRSDGEHLPRAPQCRTTYGGRRDHADEGAGSIVADVVAGGGLLTAAKQISRAELEGMHTTSQS